MRHSQCDDMKESMRFVPKVVQIQGKVILCFLQLFCIYNLASSSELHEVVSLPDAPPPGSSRHQSAFHHFSDLRAEHSISRPHHLNQFHNEQHTQSQYPDTHNNPPGPAPGPSETQQHRHNSNHQYVFQENFETSQDNPQFTRDQRMMDQAREQMPYNGQSQQQIISDNLRYLNGNVFALSNHNMEYPNHESHESNQFQSEEATGHRSLESQREFNVPQDYAQEPEVQSSLEDQIHLHQVDTSYNQEQHQQQPSLQEQIHLHQVDASYNQEQGQQQPHEVIEVIVEEQRDSNNGQHHGQASNQYNDERSRDLSSNYQKDSESSEGNQEPSTVSHQFTPDYQSINEHRAQMVAKHQQDQSPKIIYVMSQGGNDDNLKYTESKAIEYHRVNNGNQDVSNGNLQIPNGNLQIPNGNLQIPNGNLQIPNGNLQIPNGNLQIPNGNLQIPNGNLQIPNGNLQIPNGNLQIPNGNLQIPNGNLQIPNGNLQIPNGNLQISNGNLHVSNGNHHVSNGNHHVSNGNPHVSTGNRHVSNGNLHVSNGDHHVSNDDHHVSNDNLHVSNDDHHVPNGNHQVPNGNYQVSSGNHHLSNGNHVSNGNHHVSNGNHHVSNGNHHVSNGNHHVSNGNHHVSNGNHHVSNGNHHVSNGNHHVSNGNHHVSNGNHHVSNGNHHVSNGNHHVSNGNHESNGNHAVEINQAPSFASYVQENVQNTPHHQSSDKSQVYQSLPSSEPQQNQNEAIRDQYTLQTPTNTNQEHQSNSQLVYQRVPPNTDPSQPRYVLAEIQPGKNENTENPSSISLFDQTKYHHNDQMISNEGSSSQSNDYSQSQLQYTVAKEEQLQVSPDNSNLKQYQHENKPYNNGLLQQPNEKNQISFPTYSISNSPTTSEIQDQIEEENAKVRQTSPNKAKAPIYGSSYSSPTSEPATSYQYSSITSPTHSYNSNNVRAEIDEPKLSTSYSSNATGKFSVSPLLDDSCSPLPLGISPSRETLNAPPGLVCSRRYVGRSVSQDPPRYFLEAEEATSPSAYPPHSLQIKCISQSKLSLIISVHLFLNTGTKVSNNYRSKPQLKKPSWISTGRSKQTSEKVTNPNISEMFGNGAIPGEPGKDFPIYSTIPKKPKLSCRGKSAGFYSDTQHGCQVYYQCSLTGDQQGFLCPNGTLFNQISLVCEWWYNVDCKASERHFDKNKELYQQSEDISESTDYLTDSSEVEEENDSAKPKQRKSLRSIDSRTNDKNNQYQRQMNFKDDMDAQTSIFVPITAVRKIIRSARKPRLIL